MTEEIKPTGETPAAQPQAEAQPVTQTPPPAEEVFDKERAMATINALRTIEKQAKQDQKELARLKADEQKRADAELSEIDRLKKQFADAEAEKVKLQADILRRDVVAKTGLPAVFADRLKGTTEEEMTADAQEILKVLPQIKSPPHLPPTQPGNGQIAETEQQKRDRLFGQNGNVFDIKTIEAGGGGVVWTTKP